jgi:signal transduction histidine kinase/DNA-binding NarL/FixJ family response regulator
MSDQKLRQRIRDLEQENAALKLEANEESHSRLMAEEALGITEDRLQLALDAAGLASWEWDLSARLVITSARFGQMIEGHAYSSDDQDQHWLPGDLMAMVLPEDVPNFQSAVIRALKQQDDILETEFRMQTPAGLLWIECTGKVSARDMFGRAERMLGINRNITRRKQAEVAMQLAREEAESANRAKDQFLAHISHEIRTPLNGVIGMNNLLAQTDLSAEQRKYVDLVASSGRALLALVNDVLDFSRFLAGGVVLEQVRFPLRRWLWEAVMPLQITAQSKGLELSLEAADELPVDMVGDPGRMRQIVSNLVSNAIKFTERGSIHVRMAHVDQHLLISVRDTGIGIPQEKQEAIFEAFVQADSSTSRRFGGTGLGLAICMQLTQAMGGRIELQSEAGRGSHFQVWLPLLQPDEANSQQDFASTQLGNNPSHLAQPIGSNVSQPSNAPQPMHLSPTPYVGMLALVADDNEVNRLLACKLLEQLGFAVSLAEDGMKAIEAVLAQKFDVIFMDIQMPQLNGWQATHELRQWEQQAKRVRVPIIALSAHASAADREHAGSIGMDGYLSKPLTPEALSAALRATSIGQVADASTEANRKPAVDLSSNEPVQRERLLARLGGDEAALHDMARATRRDLRERMGKAYDALQSQDWPAMQAQAHALKGALSSITADRAAAHAKALERSSDPIQAKDAFEQLSIQAKQVFDALKNW